jgi:MYXO-CTERM domain-containing protein
MFEGETHRRRGGFEPFGGPPLLDGSEGRASLPTPTDGYQSRLLGAGAIFAVFGVLTLAIGVFAVHPPLTTALLGSSTGWILLALLALLAWWRRRRQRSAP